MRICKPTELYIACLQPVADTILMCRLMSILSLLRKFSIVYVYILGVPLGKFSVRHRICTPAARPSLSHPPLPPPFPRFRERALVAP